jgi:dolichol-phosphate mannosyltransferase
MTEATVIIPAKNEPYLLTLLKELNGYEVFVQTEPGLSYAVLQGIKRASNSKIIILDGDGSHPTSAIPNMLKLLDTYDIVIGSRYIQGGYTEDSWGRIQISKFYNKLAQFILQINVEDNMSGYIVAKRRVFQELNIENKGYKIGLEVIYKSKNRFKVTEYPIAFTKRKMGKSKANLRTGLQTLWFINKLFWEKQK